MSPTSENRIFASALLALLMAVTSPAVAQPSNDDCADAESISGVGIFPFDNTGATTDGTADPLCLAFGDDQVSQDIWFCWTAPCAGPFTIETCGLTDVDTKIAVYEGCACPTAAPPIACNDDTCGLQSQVQINTVTGQQYLIRLGTFGNAIAGTGSFQILGACNTCEDAFHLDVPAFASASTTNAIMDPAAVDCGLGTTAPGIWYSVEGTGSSLVASLCGTLESDCCINNGTPGCDTIECQTVVCAADAFCCDTSWDSLCAGAAADLCPSLCLGSAGADFDTLLTVYCGDCEDGLVCVAENDDLCGAASEVQWCSQAGVTYHILVHGLGGATGNFAMTVIADDAACIPEDCLDAERAHPGWNHVSTEITLTQNEPAYWSALSGQPKGVAPFTVLDPGFPPGRPDPENPGQRVLRGYVLAWAVNGLNQEIRWNHLKGDAVIINYDAPYAWEYTAWAFPVVADVAHGEQSGDPGVLNLDGIEYVPGFDQLILDFYASGSAPFAPSLQDLDWSPYVETDLTLHPISTDLRQEDDGPVTTKAKIDVWNEHEVKFNGMERCITCWDQTLISNYGAFGIPNNFLYSTLQTNKGKARIDGVRSDNCDFDFEFDPLVPFGADPRDIVSQDASLLGLSAKLLQLSDTFTVAEAPILPPSAASGRNVFGAGTGAAIIQYDVLEVTPESAGATTRRGRRRPAVGGTEGVPSSADRVSGTEKGSLLIFSKVELRWTAGGELLQDTFLDMSNDFDADVAVQMYFINGDPPLPGTDS